MNVKLLFIGNGVQTNGKLPRVQNDVEVVNTRWGGVGRNGKGIWGKLGLFGFLAGKTVTLSRSSAEAEYRGVANVVAETTWIRNLLREFHNPLFTATLVYCDNVSAVYMSTNHVQHQRTKHIEIDIHFVRDMVARGQVRVLHVPSRYQYADIFTKGLPSALFEEFRTSLSVRSSRAQTAREC
ncbi:ribonuclease H-like domain-containing protein [Tanacetum coccineum]